MAEEKKTHGIAVDHSDTWPGNVVEGERYLYRINENGEVILNDRDTLEMCYKLGEISEEEYKEEVNKTYEAILQYTGVAPRLLRAPGGRITKKQIAESPLYVINWNVDSEDWKLKGRSTEAAKKENVDKIVNNVLTHTRKGSIILMHEIYYNSYDAFCRIVDELTKKGFEFVTVSELLGEAPLGKQYYNRP